MENKARVTLCVSFGPCDGAPCQDCQKITGTEEAALTHAHPSILLYTYMHTLTDRLCTVYAHRSTLVHTYTPTHPHG